MSTTNLPSSPYGDSNTVEGAQQHEPNGDPRTWPGPGPAYACGVPNDFENNALCRNLTPAFQERMRWLLTSIMPILPRDEKTSSDLVGTYLNNVHFSMPYLFSIEWFRSQLEHYRAFTYQGFDPRGPLPADDVWKVCLLYAIYVPVLLAATRSSHKSYGNILDLETIDKYRAAFQMIKDVLGQPNIYVLVGSIIDQKTATKPSMDKVHCIVRHSSFLRLDVRCAGLHDEDVAKDRILLFQCTWWAEVVCLDAEVAKNHCCLPKIPADFVKLLKLPEQVLHDELEQHDGEHTIDPIIVALNVRHTYDNAVHVFASEFYGGTHPVDISTERGAILESQIKSLNLAVVGATAKFNSGNLGYPALLAPQFRNFVLFSWLLMRSQVLHLVVWLETKCLQVQYPVELEDGARRTRITAEGFGLANVDFQHYVPESFEAVEDVTSFRIENHDGRLVPAAVQSLDLFGSLHDTSMFTQYHWVAKSSLPVDSLVVLFLATIFNLALGALTKAQLRVFESHIRIALARIHHSAFNEEEGHGVVRLFFLVWEVMRARLFADIADEVFRSDLLPENQATLDDTVTVNDYTEWDQGSRDELELYFQIVLMSITEGMRNRPNVGYLGSLEMVMKLLHKNFM